jgi:hypothetical protein
MDGSTGLRIDRRQVCSAHETRRAVWPSEHRPLTVRATVEVTEDRRKETCAGTCVIESDDTDFPKAAKWADEAGGIAAERVRYAVDIRSPAPCEHFEAATGWAERLCHATHGLRQPIPVDATYRLNDEPVTAPV